MNKLFIFLGLLAAFTYCDFTSGLHKEILRAQQELGDQNFKKAAKIYESIIKKKPTDNILIKLHYQVSQIYSLYLNKNEKAISHLDRLVKLTKEPSWQIKALERKAVILFENLKDYKQALNAYSVLSGYQPPLEGTETYLYREAICLYKLNDFHKSYDRFVNLSNTYPGSESGIRAYYYLGMIYYFWRSWDKANEQWFEYIKREKRKNKIVQAKFMIANSFEMNEKLKEAYNIYYSILGDYPNPLIIKNRLNAIYDRRVVRKR